jgi:glutathione peroxidase
MKTLHAILATLCLMTAAHAGETNLSSIPLKDIDGSPTSLQAYAGKVLLVVNVASQCGFTPQYEGLEALWRKYKDAGLVVLGFPCNDFGAQEPGTNDEIKTFCKSRFDVTFPMFDKLHVLGAEQHPLYAALTGPSSVAPGPITWNFNKFLIGRNGAIIARFDSEVEPGSETLAKAVESALKAK